MQRGAGAAGRPSDAGADVDGLYAKEVTALWKAAYENRVAVAPWRRCCCRGVRLVRASTWVTWLTCQTALARCSWPAVASQKFQNGHVEMVKLLLVHTRRTWGRPTVTVELFANTTQGNFPLSMTPS